MKKLQDAFPDYRLGTIKECLDMLGWQYTETEERYDGITCDCGATVKTGGWVATEHAWCPACGKGMQDLTGVLPTGNSTAGFIDHNEYDLSDHRVWTPNNIWGFKE